MGIAPGYLRQGYKNSSRTWRVDGPPSKTECFQRETYDGRLDARVMPKPVKLRVRNEED